MKKLKVQVISKFACLADFKVYVLRSGFAFQESVLSNLKHSLEPCEIDLGYGCFYKYDPLDDCPHIFLTKFH